MLDLDAIKARADAATEGPWGVEGRAHPGPDEHLVIYPVEQGGTLAFVQPSWDDAEFIAHARTDIPALIAEVERLRGRIEALHPREVIAVHEGYGEEAWCPECRFHYPCQTIRALEGK